MIPCFNPVLGGAELRAAFACAPGAVVRFEGEFARAFEAAAAVAFPYGRSALWAFFRALGLDQAEVILPAYTCSVVAHAVALSGNHPRFVDITLRDYNMDLDQVEASISARTGAIVATHLFGYPLDVDRLAEIVRTAEARHGRKIWVVQDCAHAFGARWQGRLVCSAGDAGLFGLNVSKTITSIFGGMLTFGDVALGERVRAWRDANFSRAGWTKVLRRRLYLAAAWAAFNQRLYGMVDWLQNATPLLDHFTRAYHLDDQVRFPPDYADRMLDLEAEVGLVQLRKYPEIIRHRHAVAQLYASELEGTPGWALPPLVDGATYSHYVVRVPDRERLLHSFRRQRIELGHIIQYSLPHLRAYSEYAAGQCFDNSWRCSQSTINLPVHLGVGPAERARVVAEAWAAAGRPARLPDDRA